MNRTTIFRFCLILIFGANLFNTLMAQTSFPYDTRSDSISIKHYNVHLDVRDFSTFILKGHTEIIFKPLVNSISKIKLDLIGQSIDSVHDASGDLLPFATAQYGYKVDLGRTYNVGDSTSITVFYHGATVNDPSFGGFYFNSSYAFNIGVSMSDIPHNYGRLICNNTS
jgi:hypothetical protein